MTKRGAQRARGRRKALRRDKAHLARVRESLNRVAAKAFGTDLLASMPSFDGMWWWP